VVCGGCCFLERCASPYAHVTGRCNLPNTRMDATCAAGGGDTSASMIEIIQNSHVTLRMAPLDEGCIESMVKSLRAHRLLEGYRGEEPINKKELSRLMLEFSKLVMEMEDRIDYVDLNPVMCSKEKCVIADARIMLK